jgi:hypothetical protein
VSLAFAMLALSASTRREQRHRAPCASECILPISHNRAADSGVRLTAVLEQALRQGRLRLERRALFVGMSRAMRALLVVRPERSSGVGFDETLWNPIGSRHS